MDWTNYVEPGLLTLVPVLIFLGSVIKHATSVENRFIPLILTGVGVLLSTVTTLSQVNPFGTWQDALSAGLTGITQGILVAAAAVYGNQMFKQLREDDDDDE